MKPLLSILIAVGIAFGILSFLQTTPPTLEPSLGVYSPTGGGTYRLQSSVTGTQTTLTLTSFKEPISNIPYTMSYLNSDIEYATIEPQTTSNKEFISFSGITQNADGTATLTGLTRGLSFSYPFTASTTFQQSHAGQTILILSNPPQLYNKFYNLSNVSTSTNILNFSSTTPPRYDQVAAQGTGTYISTTSELASIAYVNAISIAGVSNGTTAVKGIYQTATGLQMGSSTALGSTGASLALTSANATDTPSVPQSVSGSKAIISQITGYLRQSWLNLTEAFTFSGGLTSSATTTIAASNVNSNCLKLNTICYQYPSTQGASSTVLSNNGSGVLYNVPMPWAKIGEALFAGAATTTLTLTSTTTAQDLRVVVRGVTNGSTCLLLMQLNPHTTTGSGGNYTWNSRTADAAQVGVGSVKAVQILSGTSASDTVYVNLDLTNDATMTKMMTWQDTFTGAVNQWGSGYWTDNADQLKSLNVGLSCGSGAGTMTSGRITVYASQN